MSINNNRLSPSSFSAPSIQRPLVSIVIVIWNAKKYVLECLNSLREHCKDVSAEVIVVDNASTDGTPDMIEDMFSEFLLIRNSENLGFAKANNIGIAKSRGQYICLVNSDVKFTSDCISPLLKYCEENPTVGMVGPKMVLATGKVARSTMRFPTPWNYFCRALGLDGLFGRSRLFGGFLMSDFDHETTKPVEVLNGWFVLLRRRAVERVGMLDPQFFMYGEDIDWCYRFAQAGEGVVFFADAEAIHYGGASSSSAPVRFHLEMARADWQFWRKHHGQFGEAAYFTIYGIHHVIRLLGCAGTYLCSPSNRPVALLKLRKSLASLRWLSSKKNQGSPEERNLTRHRESPAA